MKKLIAIITAITIASGLALLYLVPERVISIDSPYKITTHNKDRKKILIFSSKGGGGHIAAAEALTEYLGKDYCIGSTCVFSTLLQPVDLLSKFQNQTKSSVDSYNYLAQRNWHRLLNVVAQIGFWYFRLRKKTIDKLLEHYIIAHKPDLIISVIPIINNNLLKIAQKFDIPFLLIPTDLDGSNALYGIEHPTYAKFKLGLSYHDAAIEEKVKEHEIEAKYVQYIGFPVKTAFLMPSRQRATYKIFNIPDNKPVILLMMGLQGSEALYAFSKQIAKLSIPAHVVIVLGKSNYLKHRLRRCLFPKHISYTILDFTNHIAELMGIADLVVTKSGSVTVNEAFYSEVPLLLDATGTVLQWEDFNHTFVKKHGLGRVIKNRVRIPEVITKMLSDEEQKRMRMNLAMFDKQNPEQAVKLIVHEMIT